MRAALQCQSWCFFLSFASLTCPTTVFGQSSSFRVSPSASLDTTQALRQSQKDTAKARNWKETIRANKRPGAPSKKKQAADLRDSFLAATSSSSRAALYPSSSSPNASPRIGAIGTNSRMYLAVTPPASPNLNAVTSRCHNPHLFDSGMLPQPLLLPGEG